MSNPSFQPLNQLDLSIQPSWCAFSLYCGFHLCALSGLYFAGLDLTLKLFLILAVGLNCYHCCRHSLLLDPRAVVRLQAWQGNWVVYLANGECRPVTLKGEVIIWPHLLVAHFKAGRNRYSLLLLPDNTSKDDHRRARVYFSLYAYPEQHKGLLSASLVGRYQLAKIWWNENRILSRR